MYYDFDECNTILASWRAPLEAEIQRATGNPPVVATEPLQCEIRKSDSRLVTFDFGGCILYLTPRRVHFSKYAPVLSVCEKRRRRQRHGVGHSRDYYMSRTSGFPNFKKAVENALRRAEEISKAGIEDEFSFPDGVLVTESSDGDVILHIPMIRVSREKAIRLAAILR